MYENNSLADLKFKVRNKYAATQIDYLQQQEILAIIVSNAFGGKQEDAEPEVAVPQTKAELTAAFNNIFKKS